MSEQFVVPQGETWIVPQEGPQRVFMGSKADIALFGGAAGSGKSWALLLEAMRYPSKKPAFDSVMFRRNTTDIRRPGGLWSESMNLFPHARGIPVPHLLSWRWMNGGSVKLSHLEHETDVLAWHGSQVPCICFDELTTFTRYQFFYLMSRNRSTLGIRPYMRASCNADAGSWVAQLISWWIDWETGYPIPERSGVVRYFVRAPNDDLLWYDSKREAIAANPDYTKEMIKSFTFVAARLSDNPALMEKDPQYLGNLMMLPAVERERLLNGNWKIRPSAGLYFNRSWCQVIDIAPRTTDMVRGWDLAATPETSENDPSWTASVKIGRLIDGRYLVMDASSLRGTPADVERSISNIASHDTVAVRISIPQDPGQAGKAQVAAIVRMMAGYRVEASPETGDKLTRFSPFSAQAQAGNVLVLRGAWNERWFQVLEGFPELPHDDDVDATSRAFNTIAGRDLSVWARMVD